MCDTTNTKIIPYTVIGLSCLALAASVAKDKSKWWDNNVGFVGKSWIFPLYILLIVGFILTITYIWIWYRCSLFLSGNTINILFGTTFALIFASFISLFLFKDNKISLWLAVAAF